MEDCNPNVGKFTSFITILLKILPFDGYNNTDNVVYFLNHLLPWLSSSAAISRHTTQFAFRRAIEWASDNGYVVVWIKMLSFDD